jgi:hypothetical protein
MWSNHPSTVMPALVVGIHVFLHPPSLDLSWRTSENLHTSGLLNGGSGALHGLFPPQLWTLLLAGR